MKSGKIAGIFTLIGMGVLAIIQIAWRFFLRRPRPDPVPTPVPSLNLPDPAVLQAQYDADAKQREEARTASAKRVDEMSDAEVLIEFKKHFGDKGAKG